MFIVYFLHEEKTIRVKVIEKNWKISVREFLLFAVPFFKDLICIFWRPTLLTHHWYAPYSSLTRDCAPYPPLLSPIRPLRAFFLLCCAVLIVRYGLRLKKNPRKATGPAFIPVKVIKFTSDVIDSHLYNIIKDLGKNKYSKEPKTARVRPIFQVNENCKIGN